MTAYDNPPTPDPVHQDPDGQWYFYEETWADRQGPFGSQEEARAACVKYARWLDTGESS